MSTYEPAPAAAGVQLLIGTDAERLVLDVVKGEAPVLRLTTWDGRVADGAKLLPDALHRISWVAKRVADDTAPSQLEVASDSPRGEDLDVVLRWALGRLMAADPGGGAAVLTASRTDLGIGLEAFWLSDRGRR